MNWQVSITGLPRQKKPGSGEHCRAGDKQNQNFALKVTL
jgi:hypothetical protein